MDEIVKSNTLNSIERTDEVKDVLRLALNIRDANVIKYLTEFEEPQREEKAIEALRVGLSQSNRPAQRSIQGL